MNWTWLGLLAAGIIAISCITGYRRGFVKEIVSIFFVILSFFMVWLINPYVNTFIRENTSVYDTVRTQTASMVKEQMDEDAEQTQEDIVENLNLPQLLKEGILKNNTTETYRHLAVNSFTGYVSDSVAVMIVNGLSFLLSFVAANLAIRAAAFILNLIMKLPLLNGVNRLTGALAGGAKSIVFLWVAMLVLTLLCSTELGRQAMDMIEKDTFLHYLYEQNVIMKIFMNVL